MTVPAKVAIAVVAALHLYFLVLEMFLWNRPFGRKTFGLTAEFARESKALAANQGLYNGFVAAGLIWALLGGSAGRPVGVFFLVFVVAAGIFGALTASRKILFAQAIPGALALLLVLLS